MNCHNCKYVGTVPGSAHSSCSLVGDEAAQFQVAILYIGGGSITLENKETKEKSPLIELDSHGVKKGWAMWPVNFDPVWVKNCKGYTPISG
jgi:hypothetical protein